jgi:colanic acid/amylovoran biosynthesis glycosyltransferase
MKIAFIVTEFPALSETFILNQITGLLDLGHDVEIFAATNPHDKKTHSDIIKYGLMKRVNYFFDDSVSRNRANRVLKAIYLITSNFHKSPLIILKSLNAFKYGVNALSLLLLYSTVCLLERQFDIIHCHFGSNGIVGTQLKDIGISGKLITTFYGSDLTSFLKKKGEKVYHNLFLCGDIFLPICDYFKKKLVALKCDEKKIMIHRLGADIESFQVVHNKAGQEKPSKILTIGRLSEKKGHIYSLKAFAKIIKKHKNLKYIIAGDGPLRTELEKLATELKLSDNVEFMGAVNELEVKALFKEAHIFVLSSVTGYDGDQEGTPTVLVEAQACGLPVISTYHSGIPEVVIDGKSGFLVPEKDVDALAEKMEYLIEHPYVLPEMGSYGRMFVEEHHNIKKLNQRLVNIYHNLINIKNDKEKLSQA